MNQRLQRHLPVFAAALAGLHGADSASFGPTDRREHRVGGAILTMNDRAMRAEAVAVDHGKILAVGRRSEVMKLNGVMMGAL